MSTSKEFSAAALQHWQLGDQDALDRLREFESTERRAHAAKLALLGSMEGRGMATDLGYATMVDLQCTVLGVSRAEAKRRMERVHAFSSGAFPTAAAALGAGEIHMEHVDHLVRFHDGLSDAVHPDTWTEHEPNLVDVAREWAPLRFRRALEREVGPRLDPDGYLPTEKELAEPQNRLSFTWKRNGRLLFNGELEHEVAGLFAAYLDPHTAPRRNEDGSPDTRSLDQRRGDGMAEWIALGRDSGPIEGGERAQVTVTVGLDQLISGLGMATLGPDLLPVSVSEARRLACDCRIVPIVLGAQSMPLDIGRATRNVPPHIRRALTDRDQGCAFPGCDRPPTECQAHHVKEWQHGGETRPENLALLCRRHHRIIHHSDWEIRMSNDRPVFLPPAYLDRERRPRTNRLQR